MHKILDQEILNSIIKLQEVNDKGTYYVEDQNKIIYREDIVKKSPEDICIHKIENVYYRYYTMITTITREEVDCDDHPQLGSHTYMIREQVDENGNKI